MLAFANPSNSPTSIGIFHCWAWSHPEDMNDWASSQLGEYTWISYISLSNGGGEFSPNAWFLSGRYSKISSQFGTTSRMAWPTVLKSQASASPGNVGWTKKGSFRVSAATTPGWSL